MGLMKFLSFKSFFILVHDKAVFNSIVDSNVAANVKALAMWRYSVFRLPGAAAD
jgi:hypothetical protein